MAESARLAGRNGSIWRDYCRGTTQEALAEKHGISQARVAEIIQSVRDSVPQENRLEVIREQIDWLRETRRSIMELWDRNGAPVTAGKDGDLVYDPEDGSVVRDHTGRLNAAKVALQFAEREAKLLGLDAAQKVELSGEDEASRKLAAESAAYVNQGADDESTQDSEHRGSSIE